MADPLVVNQDEINQFLHATVLRERLRQIALERLRQVGTTTVDGHAITYLRVVKVEDGLIVFGIMPLTKQAHKRGTTDSP